MASTIPGPHKVCLAGLSGVGKTSIFNHIRGKEFSELPKAETYPCFVSCDVEVDGGPPVKVTVGCCNLLLCRLYEIYCCRSSQKPPSCKVKPLYLLLESLCSANNFVIAMGRLICTLISRTTTGTKGRVEHFL